MESPAESVCEQGMGRSFDPTASPDSLAGKRPRFPGACARGDARLLTRCDQGRRAALGYVRIQSDYARSRRLTWTDVVAPRDADPGAAPSVASRRGGGSARVRDAPVPNGPAARARETPGSSP